MKAHIRNIIQTKSTLYLNFVVLIDGSGWSDGHNKAQHNNE